MMALGFLLSGKFNFVHHHICVIFLSFKDIFEVYNKDA